MRPVYSKESRGIIGEALRSGSRGHNTQAGSQAGTGEALDYDISPVLRTGLGETEQRVNMSSHMKSTIHSILELTQKHGEKNNEEKENCKKTCQ